MLIATPLQKEQKIRIWDIDNGRVITNLHAIGHLDNMAFSPDNKYFLATNYHEIEAIDIWELPSGKHKYSFDSYNWRLYKNEYTTARDNRIRENYINALNYAANGDSDIGYLGGCEKMDKVDEEFCGGRLFHPSFSHISQYVIAAAEDGFVRIWDIESGHLHSMFECQKCKQAFFSPDDKYVIVISDCAISIHHPATGALIRKYEDKSLQFSKVCF